MSGNALLKDAILLAAVWYLVVPQAANAYFDLGTGTYLFQLFVAFAATGWFGVKRMFVRKPKPEPDTGVIEPSMDQDDAAQVRKKRK